MLFSDVKISSFRAKAPLVFHCCLYDKKTTLKSNLKTCGFCVRIHWVRVDERPFRTKTYSVSKLSGLV